MAGLLRSLGIVGGNGKYPSKAPIGQAEPLVANARWSLNGTADEPAVVELYRGVLLIGQDEASLRPVVELDHDTVLSQSGCVVSFGGTCKQVSLTFADEATSSKWAVSLKAAATSFPPVPKAMVDGAPLEVSESQVAAVDREFEARRALLERYAQELEERLRALEVMPEPHVNGNAHHQDDIAPAQAEETAELVKSLQEELATARKRAEEQYGLARQAEEEQKSLRIQLEASSAEAARAKEENARFAEERALLADENAMLKRRLAEMPTKPQVKPISGGTPTVPINTAVAPRANPGSPMVSPGGLRTPAGSFGYPASRPQAFSYPVLRSPQTPTSQPSPPTSSASSARGGIRTLTTTPSVGLPRRQATFPANARRV